MPHGDAAFGRLVEAGHAVEDGCLAGAIRADEGGDVTPSHGERQVVDRRQSAEAHRQMLDGEYGVVLPRSGLRDRRGHVLDVCHGQCPSPCATISAPIDFFSL